MAVDIVVDSHPVPWRTVPPWLQVRRNKVQEIHNAMKTRLELRRVDGNTVKFRQETFDEIVELLGLATSVFE